MKRRIDGREILRDLAAGMSEEALSKKYDLSAEQLRATREQFLEIRMRRVKSILNDIQRGMTDSQLMEKFQLSPEWLTNVKRMSMSVGGPEAEDGLISRTTANGTTNRPDSRSALRNFPSVVVSVCEPGKASTQYQLNDITEAGVGISGIEAQIGQIKTIVVLGDDLGLVSPFEFQAECRWIGTQKPDGLPCAGFRITEISDENFVYLKDFMGNFTFAIETA